MPTIHLEHLCETKLKKLSSEGARRMRAQRKAVLVAICIAKKVIFFEQDISSVCVWWRLELTAVPRIVDSRQQKSNND